METKHAAAVAYLLIGDIQEAVAAFDELPLGGRDARMWNDIAAAEYAQAGGGAASCRGLLAALVAADAALALEPAMAEARFNRALILERLGLRELAVDAWRQYLETDSASDWAAEANRHLQETSKPHQQFGDELALLYARIANEPVIAADLAQRFPQEIRTWGETEILARWAEAERTGDAVAASGHLSIAREFGDLVRARGDSLLIKAVEAIERSRGVARHALVSAHLHFCDAQRAAREMKQKEAEPLFATAASEFERGGSPVALPSYYFQATRVYEQGRVDEAARSLEKLLETAPPEFASYRAQLLWESGLCRWAERSLRRGNRVIHVGIGTVRTSERERSRVGHAQHAGGCDRDDRG